MEIDGKTLKNRNFLNFFPTGFRIACLVAGNLLLAMQPGFAAEPVSLVSAPKHYQRVRVKTTVEIEGSLQLPSKSDDGKLLPFQVAGEIFYDEHNMAGVAARHYWDAQAQLTVNAKSHSRQLRDQRRLIRLTRDPDAQPRFSSLGGPLTREELELIDVTSSGCIPELLLPGKQVEVGDHWKHSNEISRSLLHVDEIRSGDLTSHVTKIDTKVVVVELAGSIEARVDGVDTKIDVAGSYQFDRINNFVKWLAVSLKEKRAGGFAAPGFEVVAQIRSARQSIASSAALPEDLIASVKQNENAQELLLEFQPSSGEYQLLIDRRWHVLSQQGSAAMLRMVDDGDLIATCKVDRLTKTSKGKRLLLPEYEKDVRRALGKSCEQILEAEESVSGQGIQVLRVVAAGHAGEAEVRWVYYHLSDDAGRRLSLVFTHEATLANRFAGVDQALVDSLQFRSSSDEQQARQQAAQLR